MKKELVEITEELENMSSEELEIAQKEIKELLQKITNLIEGK